MDMLQLVQQAFIDENGVKAIQKWVPFTTKCSQKGWRLMGLRPRPPIARESGREPLALASLTRKIENSVDAIQQWAIVE